MQINGVGQLFRRDTTQRPAIFTNFTSTGTLSPGSAFSNNFICRGTRLGSVAAPSARGKAVNVCVRLRSPGHHAFAAHHCKSHRHIVGIVVAANAEEVVQTAIPHISPRECA
jgi:hypothetical protein